VDAIDLDGEAVDAVRAAADDEGLLLVAAQADLTAEPLPRPPYEVIVDVNYLERSLFEPIQRALAPGGLLLFETFTRDHPTMRPEYTLAVNELLHAFGPLRVLHYRDTGPRAGLVARRR
jgi:tellurite methyltransferase